MTYFSAIDKNDYARSFYLMTIWTIRYYLRIFYWALYHVVHTLFVVVCCLFKSVIGKSEWNKYLNRNNGRHDFQINLAISLINFAIALEWYGKSKRPYWMRQSEFLPCDSGIFYFCLDVLTNGVGHTKKRRQVI